MILVVLALCLVLGIGQEASLEKISDGIDISRPIDISEDSDLESMPLRQGERTVERDHGDVLREREMEKAIAKEREMERDSERQKERELVAERERARVREREREAANERERGAGRDRERGRQSDYERDRELEAKRERDREERRGTPTTLERRRGEVDPHRPTNQFTSASEVERQRERDRQEEIEREIRKAEQKKEALRNKSLVSASYDVRPSSRVVDNRRNDNDRIRQAERERAIQRERERNEKSHRRHEGHGQRDRDRDQRRDGGSARDHDHRHDGHRFSHEKPPILIIEEVPNDSTSGEHTNRHPVWRGRPNTNDRYRGPGGAQRPIQDPRAPDRHPVLPRPSITNLDRRPGRPDYPSKYDEVHLDIIHEHFPHHGHDDGVVKPIPIPPPPPPPVPIPVPVPVPAPDPGLILQQQLGQALLTKHAIEAGVLTKAATLGVLGAIKAGAAAHLGALGAGAAVSNIKHAVKDKLKTHLKHKVAQTIAGGVAVPAGLHALKVHTQLKGAQHQLRKAREAILLKLLLLRPYFKHVGPTYIIPPELPDIPIGVHLTPVEVEQLPRIYIDQVPHGDAFAPIHIPELKDVLEPPLEAEYVEYILGLPENLFSTVTSMSKREFLVTLFPRLYRDSVRDLDPVEDTTPVYIPSKTATSSYSVPPVYEPPEVLKSTYDVPTATPVYTPPRITPHHVSSPKPPPPLYSVPSTPASAYGPPPITTPKPPPPIVVKSPKPIITTTHRPIITTHTPIITTTHNPIITTTFKPAITTTFAPSPPSPSYGPPPQPPPQPPPPVYGPPPQPPPPVYGPPPQLPSPAYGPPPQLPPLVYGLPPQPPSLDYGAPATPSELVVVNHVDCHDHDDPHAPVEHHHIHHHVHVSDDAQHRDPVIVPERPIIAPEINVAFDQVPVRTTHHTPTLSTPLPPIFTTSHTPLFTTIRPLNNFLNRSNTESTHFGEYHVTTTEDGSQEIPHSPGPFRVFTPGPSHVSSTVPLHVSTPEPVVVTSPGPIHISTEAPLHTSVHATTPDLVLNSHVTPAPNFFDTLVPNHSELGSIHVTTPDSTHSHHTPGSIHITTGDPLHPPDHIHITSPHPIHVKNDVFKASEIDPFNLPTHTQPDHVQATTLGSVSIQPHGSPESVRVGKYIPPHNPDFIRAGGHHHVGNIKDHVIGSVHTTTLIPSDIFKPIHATTALPPHSPGSDHEPIQLTISESDYKAGPIHVTISEPAYEGGPIHVTTSQPHLSQKPENVHHTTHSPHFVHHSTHNPDHVFQSTHKPDTIFHSTHKPHGHEHIFHSTHKPDHTIHTTPDTIFRSTYKPDREHHTTHKPDQVHHTTRRPDYVHHSTQIPGHVHHPTHRPGQVHHPTHTPDHLYSIRRPDHVRHSTQRPGHVHHSTQRPGHVHHSTYKPDHIFHSTHKPQGVPEVIHVVTQEPPLSTHHVSTVNPLLGGVVLPIEHHSIKPAVKPDRRPGIPVTTSTVVVGVGVRPHGSENQFFTPVSSTVHPPFSPITPLFPATTVGTPITSTYAVVPSAATTPSSIPSSKHFTTIRPPLTSIASVLPITTSSYADIGPISTEPPGILTSTYSSIFPLTPTRIIPTTPKPTFKTTTRPFPTTLRPTIITTSRPLPTTNRPSIITTARPIPTTKRPTIYTTLRSFPTTIRPAIVPTTYPTTQRPTIITTLRPFTTTRRRPSTTTKPPFVIPSAVPSVPTPFDPATTPVFTVTEIPATTTSSTVFQLSPTVIGNGQFEIEDNTLPPRPLESDEIDILDNLDLNIDVSTERLSFLDVGKDLTRHPGTDANDDVHVLSPFTKRKGNATENNQDYDDDDPFGLYTDYMDRLLSQSPESSSHATNTRRLVTGTSAINTTTTTAPIGGETSYTQVAPPPAPPSLPPALPQTVNTLRNRRVPTPQLVAGDGVPLPEGQAGLTNLQELLAAAAAAANEGGAPGGSPPRQITAEDLAKLPAYLREAPTCATFPANRSFCLMPQDYPSDLAATLVSKYEKEMQQINDLLKQLPSPSVDITHASKQIPTIDTSVDCQKEERTVELSWSRDILGSWFVIMQTPPFSQTITVTTCSAAARLQGCRPLLQPRPLIAFQPRDPEPRPFVFDFPLPVACVFAGVDPLQRVSVAG
ncbi:mucin-2-like isoform X3 [Penaeus indicus]|uniref:mucin-2-like isoform X3 n=1 Tax=Penaeus indicus TaxID=29960 RepID=UPI00300CA738